MERHQVQTEGTPSELRWIPEREWPDSFEQYRGLTAIWIHRRKAVEWWCATVVLCGACTALAAFSSGWPDNPWSAAVFNAAFSIPALVASYHIFATGFARCPRCAWFFYFTWLSFFIGTAFFWRRRCGRCQLNLDTAAPAFSRYFHRRFGIPQREDGGYPAGPWIFR